MVGKKKNILKAAGLTAAFLALAVPPVLGREAVAAGASQYRVIQWEMKLRIFEGVKEGIAAAPAVVTSSYLKYRFAANFPADENLAEEQAQVKRIFNLKEARLLTEGVVDWKAGKPAKVDYVFRLDGKEYLLRVKGGDPGTPAWSVSGQSFGVEVLEKTVGKAEREGSRISLLDTDINVSDLKNVTVLGFEDSQGKPYFISLRQTKMYAAEADLRDGGSTVGRPSSDIKPPKAVKQVEPVYPEMAKKAGVAGIVVVQLGVDVNGKVANIKVIKSIPLLDQAAVEAVRQWEYEPLVVDGKRRPVVLTATIQFMLTRDKDGKVTGAQAGVVGGVVGGILGPTAGETAGWIDPKTLGAGEGDAKSNVKGEIQGGVVGGVLGGGAAGAQEREKQVFQGDAVKAVGDIKPPLLIHSVDPVYPKDAAKAGIEGTVIMEARTDEKGNVEAVRILRSIPQLDDAAVAAVKQWKYEPMTINGKPRKILFTVTVRFMLTQASRDRLLEEFARGAVKAEGPINPPHLIQSVNPVYPENARGAGVEGMVILSVRTAADGHVEDAMILRSIPLLDQAAIDAVKRWKYEPMIIDGKPVSVVFTVTVRFQPK